MGFKSRVGYRLEKAISMCGSRAGDIGSFFIAAIVALIVVDISLRHFFNAPLSYSLELIEGFLLIAVMTSIFYTSDKDSHVSIDLITARLPERVQKKIILATDWLSGLFFLIVTWRSIVQALHVRKLGTVTPILEIPYYPLYFVMALCVFFVAIKFLLRALRPPDVNG